MPPKEKTKRSLRPEFISWSERAEPLRGFYRAMSWQDMKTGDVPKYTLDTENGLVSFLGTTQIVEAFENLRFGADVELIPGGKVKTGNNFMVIQFEINVYEDEPGESDKKLTDVHLVSSEGEELFPEEVAA